MTEKRQKEKRLINRFQHGFTLAELLIVVAIIGILAAFGFVSVYQYQKNLHLTELDDTAKEIFVAAQNHLTVAKASGDWDEFYQTTVTDENGNTRKLTKEELQAKSDYGSPMEEKPKDYPKNDFASDEHDYRSFVVGDSNTEKLQDYILPKNAIDGTIMPSSLNDTHTIVIEYDAKTAVIYAVWYTDGKNGWFGSAANYKITDDDKKAGRPADKNDTDAKKYRHDHKPQIGYYGGGMRQGTSGDVASPKAEIVNADRLYLRVKYVDKNKNTTLNANHSNPSNESVIIKVKGDTSSTQRGNVNKQPVELNSVLNGNLIWYENQKFEKTNGNDAVYTCYMLDSVTDGQKGHFSQIFDYKKTGMMPGENITINVYKVRGTKIKSQELHTNSLFQSIVQDPTTKSYMANIKYGRHLQNLSSDVSEISWSSINHARLTDNIDWDNFYLDEKKPDDKKLNDEKSTVEKRYATENSGLAGSDPKYKYSITLANPGLLDNAHKDNADTKSYAFYSIHNKYLNDFDGNNKSIRNLYMQQEYHDRYGNSEYEQNDDPLPSYVRYEGAGLFGLVRQKLDIHDLKMVNPSFDENNRVTNAGALIGSRDYEGATLSIKRVDIISDKDHSLNIKSSNSGGVLIGYNGIYGGNTTTISETNIKLNAGGAIEAENGCAGGFIGFIGNKAININNSEFTSSGEMKIVAAGSGYNGFSVLQDPRGCAGGIIGCVSSPSTININNVAVRGINNSSITIDASCHAGGAVGFMFINSANNDNVVSNVHYDGGDKGLIRVVNAVSNADPRAAGGFIGSLVSTNLKISNCNTTTYVSVKAVSTGYGSSAGGFIGYFRTYDKDNQGSANTTIQNCYYGGRVDDQGNFVKKLAFDNDNQFNKGGYNIANLTSSGIRVSGGFIGWIARCWAAGHGKIIIQNSYTTGSVYLSSLDNNKDSQSGVGGFIGLVKNLDRIDGVHFTTDQNPTAVLNDTYATGLVKCGDLNDSKKIGTYIGTTGAYSIDGSQSQNNYYLSGVDGNEGIDCVGGNYWDEKNANGSYSQVKSSEYYVDAAGAKHQLIFGEAGINETGTPFAVADENKVNSYPYSEALKGKKYPFASVTSEKIDNVSYGHVGDWPVVAEPPALKGTFGLLYYEKIQDDPVFYYNGYMVEEPDGLTVDQQKKLTYDKAKYEPMKTSLSEDIDPDQDGLINSKGKYVSEDGYILLVDDSSLERLQNTWVSVWGVNQFNNEGFSFSTNINHVPLMGDNSLLTPYKSLDLNALGLKGYQAYSFDMNKVLTTWDFHAEQQGASLTFFEKYSNNGTDQYVNKASFSFMPIFAGSIKAPDKDGKLQKIGQKEDGKDVYRIRSARQLNALADMDGDTIKKSFLSAAGEGESIIQIAMDITFDPNKVHFTMCSASGDTVDADSNIHITKNSSKHYENHTFSKTSPKAILESSKSPDGQLYSLDGLTNPLVGKNNTDVGNTGLIRNLLIENSNIPYLVSINGDGTGIMDNISVRNTNFTQYGLTYENTDKGLISNVSLDNCSTVNGADGFAYSSAGRIENSRISNSNISGNGVLNMNEWGKTVSGITITNTKVGGNGLVATNEGTIQNCNIRNAQIGKNGAFESSAYDSPVSGIHIVNAVIAGNGFMDNTYSDVSDSYIVNAQIGGSGFARTVGYGTISNCYVVGDKDQYQVSDYFKPNEATIDKAVNDGQFGYNLVTIGFNAAATEDNAGFIHNISNGTVNINNCYVAGKVYGRNAYGFIGNVTGGSININNSYANTIVNASSTGSGFAGNVSGGQVTVNKSHSLGIINAKNGQGFARNSNNDGLSISDSYSAVWGISGMDSRSYLPFSNASNKNNYVMEFSDGLGNYDWNSGTSAKAVNADELKKLNGTTLGGKITGKTHKYYQYAVAGEYPYPMPLTGSLTTDATTLDHYGDWYDPDNQNILVNPETTRTVQFFKEDGTPLSDVLKVNDGASVRNEIPDPDAPEGKEFAGWYNNNTDFSDADKISDDSFNSVKTDIKAYAHYVTKAPYVELHYVNPADNSIGTLGVAENKNGTVNEPSNIRKFGGYTRENKWYTAADESAAGVSSFDADKDTGVINGVNNNVRDLYLHYQKTETHDITIEIRADNKNKEDNENQTYPQIHQSYIHEYPAGQSYDTIKQTLPDLKVDGQDSNYQIEEDGLKVRDLGVTDSVKLRDVNDADGAKLVKDGDTYTVELTGTADQDKTYVVLYSGRTVNYTIRHKFKNSIGTDGTTKEIEMPANISDKLAYANSVMKYSSNPNDTFIIDEKRTGSLGEYVDLEKATYTTSDNSDSGFDVVLNPDSNFVLNTENEEYEVNYSRKKYNLTIDTDGAEVVKNSPVEVHFGEDISADSTYLSGIPDPNKGKNGFTLDQNNKWSYTKTADGTPVENNNGTMTMPAENVTAKANWIENKTAPYTVEVWTQKVDESQSPTTENKDKQYDFYDSFTVNADDSSSIGNTGIRVNPGVNSVPGYLSNPDATNALVNGRLPDSVKDLKYFSVNTVNAENRNDTDGNNETNSGTVTIRSDGTTVYRVFYDRKTITFNFNYGRYKISQESNSQQLYVRRERIDYGYGYVYSYSLTTDSSQRYAFATQDNIQSYYGYYIFNDPENGWQYLNGYSDETDKWGSGLDANGNSITTLIRTQKVGTPVVETYKGLYGQEFNEATDIFKDNLWRYGDASNGSNLTSLMNYILPDDNHDNGNETTLTLECQGKNNGNAVINHYQENLDGSWDLKTETRASSNSNFNLTNKYDGFTVYGFLYGNNYGSNISKNIRINTAKNTSSSYPRSGARLNIFHTRNSNNITLMNVEPMKGVELSPGFTIDGSNNINVKYEQPLKDIGLPSDPEIMNRYIPKSVDRNGVTDGYTFGGWYTSESFAEGTELNPDYLMPNHKIHLYAKWIAPKYKVTYMDGDKQIAEEEVERFGNITYKDDSSLKTVYQKSDSSLVGWYTNKDLSDNSEFLSSRAVMEPLTLYAKYDKAPGTDVTYTVSYINYEDKSEVYPTKTVHTQVGQSYEERPIDIPNAISLDVRHSGRVTGDMEDITFRYLMYKGSSWSYQVENKVVYNDLDNRSNSLEASISTGSQSTTNTTKSVNAENIKGYHIYGDDSKSVTKPEGDKSQTQPAITFEYVPDYAELGVDHVSSVYGESKDPAFTGMDKWIKPNGYDFKAEVEYFDASGNKLDKRPVNAGTYKADLTLVLTNGTNELHLYTRKNVTYRILKKSIVLTSDSQTWPHDGEPHKSEKVTVDPPWVGTDGAVYDFSGSEIQDVGTIPNEFTVTPEGSTDFDNYNIYRQFGTLTVTDEPVKTGNEETASSKEGD